MTQNPYEPDLSQVPEVLRWRYPLEAKAKARELAAELRLELPEASPDMSEDELADALDLLRRVALLGATLEQMREQLGREGPDSSGLLAQWLRLVIEKARARHLTEPRILLATQGENGVWMDHLTGQMTLFQAR